MSEAKEKGSRSRTMGSLSLELDMYPRDLLQRFMSTDTQKSLNKEDTEEIELNLGLSLGGRFGVDKAAKKLTRSSSIAGTIPLIREDGALTSPPVHYPSLTRTSSLPAETEEEWRKRKEMQTLRRMEAKRRRSDKEKQRNSSIPQVNAEEEEEERRELSRSRSCMRVQPPFGLDLGGTSGAGVKGKECGTNPMEDMPCVFTKGDGPNGKIIEGILYKYGEPEDVRIMCVCHGEFLSPAEFVKHAGGGDVDHPLRHIVVNRSSLFL